jgi:hypothetical protein
VVKTKSKRKINRCIKKHPDGFLFYLVDPCFLYYKYVREKDLTEPQDLKNFPHSSEYWKIITSQIESGKARVFVPDICIAETFNTFSRKRFNTSEKNFHNNSYSFCRKKMIKDISIKADNIRKSRRKVGFYNLSLNREIIIGIDRFYEKRSKSGKNRVSTVDLIILSTALYLIDFLGLSKDSIKIVSRDKELYELARSFSELPDVFNPDLESDRANKVFV